MGVFENLMKCSDGILTELNKVEDSFKSMRAKDNAALSSTSTQQTVTQQQAEQVKNMEAKLNYQVQPKSPITKISAGDLARASQKSGGKTLQPVQQDTSSEIYRKYPMLVSITGMINSCGLLAEYVEATNGLIQLKLSDGNALVLDLNWKAFGPEPKIFIAPDPYMVEIEYTPVFGIDKIIDILSGNIDVTNPNLMLYNIDVSAINRLVDFASIKANSLEARTGAIKRIINAVVNTPIFDMVKEKQQFPRFVLENGPINSESAFTLVSSGANKISINGENVPESTTLRMVFEADGVKIV